MRKALISMFVAVLALFLVFSCSPVEAAPATPKQQVIDCMNKEIWKDAGVAAAYGGGVLAVGTGLGILLAPEAIPVGIAATLVGSNAVTGALLGAGSSLVSSINMSSKVKVHPYAMYCAEKLVTDNTKKAQDLMKSALTF